MNNFYTLLISLKMMPFHEVPTVELPVLFDFQIRRLDHTDFRVVDLQTNKEIFTSIYNLEKALQRRYEMLVPA